MSINDVLELAFKQFDALMNYKFDSLEQFDQVLHVFMAIVFGLLILGALLKDLRKR
jgi:hypothetical protein